MTMTATATTTNKSPEQIESEQVIKDLNAVLEKAKFALQPYLIFNEKGVIPAVKVVKLPELEAKVIQDDKGKGSKITK